MKKNYFLSFAFLIYLLAASPLYGLDQYGVLLLDQGTAHISREGKTLDIKNIGKEIPILKNDVILLGKESKATLSTVEKVEISLGSNALFQVRPWKQRDQTGYLRMIYGKAKFKAEKTGLKRRFRVKTSMAVIGVRGTTWWQQTTPEGNTTAITTEGTIGIKGLSGMWSNVPTGMVSVTVNGKSATAAVSAPPAMQKAAQENNLTSPEPAKPTASVIVGQESFVVSKVITTGDLQQSQQEKTVVEEPLDPQQQQTMEVEKEIIADPDFEQELQENDAINETIIQPDTTEIQTKVTKTEKETSVSSKEKSDDGKSGDSKPSGESDSGTADVEASTDEQPQMEIMISEPEIDMDEAKAGSIEKAGRFQFEFEE